jgi:hypothetical protein
MITRSAFVLISRLFMLLAAGVAGDAARSDAEASDEAIRAYFRSLAGAAGEPEVTGSVGAPAAGAVPLTAAAIHARAARTRFDEARVAMERQLLLHEPAPNAGIAAIETAMTGLRQEMTALSPASQASDAVKKALALSQDWYQAGLKILKPPAGGLVELPLPMVVARKGAAAAVAFDDLVQEASAAKPQRSAGPPKKRARASARPAAAGADTIAASVLDRDTIH